MSDPYQVLGISSDADEAELRRRYLELVRESPPDRAPERFAAVRAAYDEVRDPAKRLSALLFEHGSRDTIAALEEELRARLRAARLPLNAVLALAESS